MTEHLDTEQLLALALVSSGSAGDDALRSAHAHVESCPACAARLRENQALFALIDDAQHLPPVSPALRARVIGSAQRTGKTSSVWAKLSAALAVLISGLLAWHDGNGGALHLADLVPHLGIHCLAFQAGFAALPLGVGMVLTRAGKVRLQPLAFSAWSMGFAVLGQVALRNHCEASNLSVHLFAVHFTGVLLAGLIAGGLGRALQPARPV